MGYLWRFVIALIFISIGVGILFDINLWKYFLPILFILLGLSILVGHSGRHAHQNWQGSLPTTETHEDAIDMSVVFSGVDRKVVTNNFTGGKISTVFGGVNLDLRQANIAKNKEAILDISAVFGGVKIIIPKTWRVEDSLSGFAGGFHNTAITPSKQEGTLIVKGSTVFGGGEIAN